MNRRKFFPILSIFGALVAASILYIFYAQPKILGEDKNCFQVAQNFHRALVSGDVAKAKSLTVTSQMSSVVDWIGANDTYSCPFLGRESIGGVGSQDGKNAAYSSIYSCGELRVVSRLKTRLEVENNVCRVAHWDISVIKEN